MEKIILITGATDGIGKATAIALAKQGNKVIVHGRNKEKTEKVVAEIKELTKNNNIDYVIADLFSLESVRKMVEEIKENYTHLDVLINNAGAVFDVERVETVDGVERTLALNTISPTLLAELLVDHIAKSEEGRIIYTVSEAHRMIPKVDINDINFENEKDPQARYGKSKLFMIWLARKQAKLLKERGINNITVNVGHPGMVATNFGQNSNKGFLNNLIYGTMIVLYKMGIKLASSVEDGAKTTIYLATSNEVKRVTGKYFGNSKEEKPSEKYYSLENEQRIWDYTMDKIRKYM